MKTRTIIIMLWIAALLVPGWSASGQDDPAPNEFLRLLSFVPDTPSTRGWLTFGDPSAWHTSWDVPRLDSVEDLDALERDPRAYWMQILYRQTLPPDSLGVRYLMVGDQREFYGFDFFQMDRFIQAGQPPETVTYVEHHADPAEIAARLLANGYTASEQANGWTLYSFGEDYEMNREGPRVGMFGDLNRIALRDNQMIIARATEVVVQAIEAETDQPSLAGDPSYAAAAQAIFDPALDDTGELVGVMTLDEAVTMDPAFLLGENASEADVEALREQLGMEDWPELPMYDMVAFATRHAEGASYLIAALVFPPATDEQAAADALASRVQDYISTRYGEPLSDRWTFDRALGVEANGLSVALLVMRVDDPPPDTGG